MRTCVRPIERWLRGTRRASTMDRRHEALGARSVPLAGPAQGEGDICRPFEWPGQESNLRATDYESAALTAELPGHCPGEASTGEAAWGGRAVGATGQRTPAAGRRAPLRQSMRAGRRRASLR